MQTDVRNLRLAYCQKYRCDLRRFRRRMFWRCLYPHAVFLAPLLLLLEPTFFRPDLGLIDEVGEATSIDEVAADINGFVDTCQLNGGVLHQRLRIRISGKKLMQIALACLEGPP